MKETKCLAGGAWEHIFSKSRTVLGSLQGTGVTTTDRPHPAKAGPGQARAGHCQCQAGHTAVFLPLPLSTHTKETSTSAYAYGLVMLLNIFKVAKLGSNSKSTENRFKHATETGLDGDCGTLDLDLLVCFLSLSLGVSISAGTAELILVGSFIPR